MQTSIMLVILLFVVSIFFVSNNLSIRLVNNELSLYLFKLRFYKIATEKLLSLIKSMIEKQDFNDEKTMIRLNNIMNCISFDYVNISLYTIVNNYNSFIYENTLLVLFFKQLYPLISNKVKRLDFCYKCNLDNSFLVEVNFKINVIQLLIIMIKGEKKYVRKTN